MRRLSIPLLRFSAVISSCAAAILVFLGAQRLPSSAAQSAQGRQDLHSVLSHVMLTPPLRSPEVSLRFSPDGQYLLLQDPAGVVVLARNPLRILFHISADNIYPAQFSDDSQSLVLVSRGLNFAKWKLPEGEKLANGDLPTKLDCADGQLSPDGATFACLKPDFHFALFDLSSQKIVLDELIAPAPPAVSGRLRSFYSPVVLFFISLDNESAFPSPFGIFRTSEPRPNPNRSLFTSSIHFSPDAKVLVAGPPKNPFAIDVALKKKFEPPSAIQKAFHGAATLQSADRFIAIDSSNGTQSQNTATVFSLRNGDALARLPVTATRLRIATNPRFLVSYNTSSDGQNAAAFDLEQNHPLETPPAVALDVRGDELAVYTVNGSIAFYHLNERNLLAHLPLPLATLPLPRCAALTANLDKLLLAIDGVGALFDLSDGRRLATVAKFSAANFLNEREASLSFPASRDASPHISRLSISSGALSPSWEVGKEQQLRSGGPALFEYSFLKEMIGAQSEFPALGLQAPYSLRSLDPATGEELWKRTFRDNSPTPFADPQGQRLVLGWKAKTSEAKSAANHNPAARDILKNAKLTDRDSYFEALDARSGNSVGGVLVTVGNGAATFDAAFSVGDAMILQKDGVRVSMYLMSDGQLKARLVGVRPSASAESNLLALDLGGGRLGIFDLANGTKLDEQLFPDGLAYTHFSGDGKRLFVLTEHQTALILDVTDVRKANVPASQTKELNN